MLDRLRQGGLPHVDATEPYEPVIDYSDDDDYAFIDDSVRYSIFLCLTDYVKVAFHILLFMSVFFYVVLISFTLCHGRC